MVLQPVEKIAEREAQLRVEFARVFFQLFGALVILLLTSKDQPVSALGSAASNVAKVLS